MVAIPVRDEAERIPDCLAALAVQEGGAPGILLLVNNTRDATVQAVMDCQASLGCPVVTIEHQFPPEQANAGQARKLAMHHADTLAPPGIPLLTTDADGRAAPDWLAANLFHLGRGLDAVFGRAEIDPVEATHIPPALHQADAEECAYAAILDQIASLIDPDPDDPWPRHTEHSGASIAVSRAAYRQVGGIPGVALGEDRAFHQALRLAEARIRHAPEARVVVSGRILGRAAGGMADTIRRRLVAPDTMLDDALEPVRDRVRRLWLRRDMRLAMSAQPVAAGGHRPSPGFGIAWAALEATRPMLRVPVAALAEEMAAAVQIRDALLQPGLSLVGAGSSRMDDQRHPAGLSAV